MAPARHMAPTSPTTYISTNQYGYNIDKISVSGLNVNASCGTCYLNLQNAVVPSGDPVYWDENSGSGCRLHGLSVAGLPERSRNNPFGIVHHVGNGNGPPPECFESQGKLQIIYSFTPQQGEGNGVAIDKTGNLYGTTGGGDNGAGFAYKLARFAGWLLDPLFSFFGGYNGGPPFGAIVGPNGSLYGGADGGIQNCGIGGSQYCGIVFNLTPQPTACLTAMCSWTENVPYRFSSESDGYFAGFTGINVSASDQEGNLYGTTTFGGAYDAGTVFELTPSGGGWKKTTLYSFTGGNDGSNPTQVLVGNDGNLYGVAFGGMYGLGVVFQLTPSGGGWTESVIHDFQGDEGDGPSYLVQDSGGNLYGIVNGSPAIFTLQKTSSGWAFSEYFIDRGADYDTMHNLTIDAAGNLYGTETHFIGTFYYGAGAGASGAMVRSGLRNRIPVRMVNNYIFKAGYAGGAWYYEDLDFLENMYFTAGGSLALDASGNLYGTTSDCGTYGSGTVWQLSP